MAESTINFILFNGGPPARPVDHAKQLVRTGLADPAKSDWRALSTAKAVDRGGFVEDDPSRLLRTGVAILVPNTVPDVRSLPEEPHMPTQ